MIKPILIGISISGVTLGACYGALMWQAGQTKTEAKQEKFFGKLEQVKTNMISVPIVSDAAIQGYVIAQFVFTAEAETLKKLSVQPETFLLDEAFKIIFAGDVLQFKTMTKGDLVKIAKQIADNVNSRLGTALIHEVLVQELNFVPKDQARGGPKL
ncbi:MAG: hypothetical protein ACOYLQ_10680 [Hyphomicrobiaceae bacterium]